jgi:endonuclease YncB( thermonuclease family)
VTLNGKDYPVFFNDGDSFRVLSGDLKGSKARLGGFNTLESYGPVHSWGDWTTKELYVVAKMGTYNARKGVWDCTSDLAKDTYGRTLWRCEDLSNDQIRKGYAHAMSVTSEPAEASDVAAQREAIQGKRGMWAHGVPEYVLTSLHSASEGGGKDGKTYNRLVSSVDGHSLKWRHEDNYEECQNVCWKPTEEERLTRFTERLAKRVSSGLKASDLTAIAQAFIKSGEASVSALDDEGMLSTEQKISVLKELKLMKHEGWVEAAQSEVETCMIYVDFRRRFGAARAVCLK